MQSGKLRHRVRIERKTEANDTFGQPQETWAKMVEVWAAVTQQESVFEGFSGRSDQRQAIASYKILVRVRSDFTPSVEDRVIWNDKTIEIHGIVESPKSDELTLQGSTFAT